MSQESDNTRVELNFNMPPISLYREFLQPRGVPDRAPADQLPSGHSVSGFEDEIDYMCAGALLLSYTEEVAEVHTRLNPMSESDVIQRFCDEAEELTTAISAGLPDWEALDELADVLFFLTRAAMSRGMTLNRIISYGVAKIRSRNEGGKDKRKERQLAMHSVAHPR